jgi:hypothetical protein
MNDLLVTEDGSLSSEARQGAYRTFIMPGNGRISRRVSGHARFSSLCLSRRDSKNNPLQASGCNLERECCSDACGCEVVTALPPEKR